MAYKVQLIYFRPTGKYLTTAETVLDINELVEIWEEIDEMRRLGRLPGLRPNAGRDLLIVVDVPAHPQRVLHLVTPPFIDEDDVTPPRIATEEMVPIMRMPLAELPRTTTKDIVRRNTEEDEVTPVDVPIPKRPRDK